MKHEIFDWINDNSIEANWGQPGWDTIDEYLEKYPLITFKEVVTEECLADFKSRKRQTNLEKAKQAIDGKEIWMNYHNQTYISCQEAKHILSRYIKD